MYGTMKKSAFNAAIETLRKYQKIEEIVARWRIDTWTVDISYECMVQISNIIADGKDLDERQRTE